MDEIIIYFGPHRDKPVYYFYNGYFYDVHKEKVYNPYVFGDQIYYIPGAPDLDDYSSITVTSLKYCPTVICVPGKLAIYLDQSEKIVPIQSSYTNWYVNIPTPIIGKENLYFEDKPENPKLTEFLKSLSPFPQVLFKILDFYVFYDMGNNVTLLDGKLEYNSLPLIWKAKHISPQDLRDVYPKIQGIYLDDLNRKLLIMTSEGLEILKIQFTSSNPIRYVLNSPNLGQSSLSIFGLEIPPIIDNLNYYKDLIQRVLFPIIQKGVQTGLKHDNYLLAQQTFNRIQELNKSIETLQTQMKEEITKYNQYKQLAE